MLNPVKKKLPAILLLSDGTVFRGKAIGKIGTVTGELCFNTGMTGYQEIFSDPSYFGQLMLMTNVHIGNYGVEPNENESDGYKISGLICRNFSEVYSRKRSNISLKDDFLHNNVVGISDIDTRALVAYIRDKGAMNAIVSSENDNIEDLKVQLASVPSMEGLELSSLVSTKQSYLVGNPEGVKIAAIDYGIKRNILRCFEQEGFYIKVFPWNSSIKDIMEFSPQGIHLSNGPGDPGAMPMVVNNVREFVFSGLPVFGICLGHQLIAEAYGLRTYKMKNGHRGINHPVKNLLNGKCEITSQNHGFAVDEKDAAVSKELKISHVNLNDGTIEGLKHINLPVSSIQYHPEAAPGPHDSRYLFTDFKKLISEK
jgi:carbamoyl-phosphate synthase small subunit